MVVGGVIAFCVLLAVLAFLVPRLSRPVQRGGDRTLGVAQSAGGKAPGPIGRLFSKGFGTSRRAVNKSGNAGRRGRAKMPV
jgi:Family of unknown function (DUF6411)